MPDNLTTKLLRSHLPWGELRPRPGHYGGRRSDPDRGRHRHDDRDAVRDARRRRGLGATWPCCMSITMFCKSTTRTCRTTATCSRSAAATESGTHRPATASRTTSTSNASAGPASCSSAPTRTRQRPVRSGMFAVGAGGLDVAVAMAGYGFQLPVSAGNRSRADRTAARIRRAEGHCPGVVAPQWRARWSRCRLRVLWRRRGRHLHGRPGDDLQHGHAKPAPRQAFSRRMTRPGSGWPPRAADEDFRALAADPDAGYDAVERIELSELEPLIALPQSPGQRGAGQRCRRHSGSADLCRLVGQQLLRRPAQGRRDAAGHAGAPGRAGHRDTGIQADPRYDHLAPAFTTTCSRLARGCSSRSAVRASASGRRRSKASRRCAPSTATFQGEAAPPNDARLPLLARHRCGECADRPDHRPRTVDCRLPRAPAVAPDLAPPRQAASSIHARRDERRGITIERGDNLVAPARPACRCPRTIDGRVLVVVGDDISTGDMAPDGAVGDGGLVEHRRMCKVHVPPLGPGVSPSRRRLGAAD